MLAIGEIYNVRLTDGLPNGYASRNFRFAMGTYFSFDFGPSQYSAGGWSIVVPSAKTILVSPGYVPYGVWCVDTDVLGLVAEGKILSKIIPGRLTI